MKRLLQTIILFAALTAHPGSIIIRPEFPHVWDYYKVRSEYRHGEHKTAIIAHFVLHKIITDKGAKAEVITGTFDRRSKYNKMATAVVQLKDGSGYTYDLVHDRVTKGIPPGFVPIITMDPRYK